MSTSLQHALSHLARLTSAGAEFPPLQDDLVPRGIPPTVKGTLTMKTAKPKPYAKPVNPPTRLLGQVADTVVKATQQPGGAATLGKKLVDIANQPKNPEGR
jgi:hypothetical protein